RCRTRIWTNYTNWRGVGERFLQRKRFHRGSVRTSILTVSRNWQGRVPVLWFRAWCGKPYGNRGWLWETPSPVRRAGRSVVWSGASEPCRAATEMSKSRNRTVIAAAAGGIFFPQRTQLRLDGHEVSPGVLLKAVTAGGEFSSFERASQMLDVLADVQMSGMQVARLTEEIGNELVAVRDERADRHRRREFPSEASTPVPIACVETDG